MPGSYAGYFVGGRAAPRRAPQTAIAMKITCGATGGAPAGRELGFPVACTGAGHAFARFGSGALTVTPVSRTSTMIRLARQDDDNEGRNVLGGPLETCGTSPMTGFYRNGRCEACESDPGLHVVCAEVTEAFLAFSRRRGNDLTTPVPEHGFPGLRPGDRWCLCAERWAEALEAGVAPPVHLEATHETALRLIPLDALRRHATEP